MSTDVSELFKNPLGNEADVDTKVSFRLLNSASPNGLGYSDSSICCQSRLSAIEIDKGKSKKSYKPEFVLFLRGLPVLVVEDKAPGIDLGNALRECQLYAHELNKEFSSTINPCEWCVVTDGLRLVLSRWDTSDVELDTTIDNLSVGMKDYSTLQRILGKTVLSKFADEVRSKISVYRTQPRMEVVGKNNEDIPHNEFGAKIVADYRSIFEPEDLKEREFIAKHAYIKSRHREQHADEIDRVVANAFAVSVPGAKPIRDTGSPNEIIQCLNKGRHLENQILLLVGRRGSGKTTFIDYLRAKRLPKDILDRTVWIHLNLNDAPKGKLNLQEWVFRQLVKKLEASAPKVDFDSPKTTMNLFAKEIREYKKRVLFNLEENSNEYKSRLTDFLDSLYKDCKSRVKALRWYLTEQHEKLLIVVFDNSDKRDRDDQLECFELARHMQNEIESLIVLPIRDVTYHLYKDEPPLDASSNSLVFTIGAPRLSKIVGRRIELILEQLRVNSKDPILEFNLASGIAVEYPKNELGNYLASLYRSLHAHDSLIRSIVVGLAGNDIRKAIKIFLEFIRSGLISEHYYLKMKTSGGEYQLPEHLVKQVLIRAGRRFFEEDGSFFTNLFQSREEAGIGGNVLRIVLLLTLKQIRQDRRKSGKSLYVSLSELHGIVTSAGFEEQLIVDEIDSLLSRGLVLADHQRKSIETKEDRLRISPSGLVPGQSHEGMPIFQRESVLTDQNSNRPSIFCHVGSL